MNAKNVAVNLFFDFRFSSINFSMSMFAWKMYTVTVFFWSRRWTRSDVWNENFESYRGSNIVIIDVFCKSWSILNMSIVSKKLSDLFICICLSNFWFTIFWNAFRAWFRWKVFSKNIRVRRRNLKWNRMYCKYSLAYFVQHSSNKWKIVNEIKRN